MEINEFISRFKEALQKNHSIIFGAQCSVNYNGRAESFLRQGDRIVIVKPDKTLLIHQPSGAAPVNYMKEGTSINIFNSNDKKAVIKSKNLNLKEYLTLEISRIYFLQNHELVDGEKIQLAGTEKDMADMLIKEAHLIEKGFKPVSQEEQTKYGFIDVLGYDKDNILTVIECKRYVGDLKAVSQLRRYVEKIKSSKGIRQVRGILACPKISPNAKRMLLDFGFQFKRVEPPKYLEQYDKKQRKLFDY